MSDKENEKAFIRKFIRVDARIGCKYEYTRGSRKNAAQGTVLDISGGGVKLIVGERVAAGSRIAIFTELFDGPIELIGKVVGTALEWFVTDGGKKTFWTIGVQFEGIRRDDRRRVINYVHTRMTQIREARLKRAAGQ